MRLDPGTEFSTLSTVASALVEVPETGTYRSADNRVSKFYRAGDRVSRAEYDLLQMAPVEIAGDVEPDAADAQITDQPLEIAGDVLEGVEMTMDGEPAEGIQLGGFEPDQGDETPVDGAEVEPEAKAEPKPRNKKAPEPENKAE